MKIIEDRGLRPILNFSGDPMPQLKNLCKLLKLKPIETLGGLWSYESYVSLHFSLSPSKVNIALRPEYQILLSYLPQPLDAATLNN